MCMRVLCDATLFFFLYNKSRRSSVKHFLPIHANQTFAWVPFTWNSVASSLLCTCTVTRLLILITNSHSRDIRAMIMMMMIMIKGGGKQHPPRSPLRTHMSKLQVTEPKTLRGLTRNANTVSFCDDEQLFAVGGEETFSQQIFLTHQWDEQCRRNWSRLCLVSSKQNTFSILARLLQVECSGYHLVQVTTALFPSLYYGDESWNAPDMEKGYVRGTLGWPNYRQFYLLTLSQIGPIHIRASVPHTPIG